MATSSPEPASTRLPKLDGGSSLHLVGSRPRVLRFDAEEVTVTGGAETEQDRQGGKQQPGSQA
jgi:hypothetical protein